MQRILKKDALVKKLIATETLGSTSVVCVDKTGTLTEGVMRVEKIFTVESEFVFDVKTKYLELPLPKEYERLIQFTYLCNNAVANHHGKDRESWQFIGSPTEKALLEAVFRFELAMPKLKQEYLRVDEKPFDSFTKMMTTVHEHGAGRIAISKGAPERILTQCEYYWQAGEVKKISEKTRTEIAQLFTKYSLQGKRLIATCYRAQSGWIFLGGFVIHDPVRESVPETVRLAHQAGLRVIMITGDAGLTARSIAKEIGLKVGREGVLLGEELDTMSDKDLAERIKEIAVYARVTPTHKIRIVKAWQEFGQVVAMTGDGVNDAPALKAADIGIAVGSATDVTRETADLILLKNDFSVIIEAIRQGRIIFQNIKKVTVYLLTDSFSEVVLVLGSLFFRLPLPITAVQVLWVNLVTDGFTSAALTTEKSEDDVMRFKPRPKDAPLLDRQMKTLIAIMATTTNVVLLILFFSLIKIWPHDLIYARTLIFVALGVDSLFYVFSCKSLGKSIFKINIFDNIFLLYAVLFGFVLHIVPLYIPFFQKVLSVVPLGFKDWFLILALVIFKVSVIELTKYILGRNKQARQSRSAI
ncbi:MAG: ATPase, P-type (Transporting), HAD superfamily, subfamily IC [Parcubacteria group bacterium GW2011_GWC2_38_7]|nr:MAG: ATPase, P-type (Transporting), HAD superfamily, subfamily IC [Parcubacteria group bacterium GW2011_GWC2_38_7]